MKNILKYLMILMIVISVIATLYALGDAFSMNLCLLKSECFQKLISVFEKYKTVYSATIGIIAIYIAIDQLILSRKTSYDAVKISYKEPWSTLLKERLNDIKDKNPVIYNLITINLSRIYDYLFEYDFKFSNQDDLKKFMDKFFTKTIPTFEEIDQNTIDYGCVYQDENQLHSFNSFWDVIIAIIQPTEEYKEFRNDLRQIYLNAVKESNLHRTIDKELFHTSALNALDLKLQRKREDQNKNGR